MVEGRTTARRDQIFERGRRENMLGGGGSVLLEIALIELCREFWSEGCV